MLKKHKNGFKKPKNEGISQICFILKRRLETVSYVKIYIKYEFH